MFLEQVRLGAVAESCGTPCYVYSTAAFEEAHKAYKSAFSNLNPTICYSVKANSNLSVLSLFAKLGAGFDIVSGGELERVERAGGDPGKTVFSGVGKSADEIDLALKKGILFFNVESYQELETIDAAAIRLGKKAPVSLRVNPDIDSKTHPYISTGFRKSKFGIDIREAAAMYEKASAMDGIEITGIDAHIGSQIFEVSSFEDSVKKLVGLLGDLRAKGINPQYLDIGGGLGVRYGEDDNPSPLADFAASVERIMEGTDCSLVLEPGRSLAANAGVLLTRTRYIKRGSEKKFVVVDAALNDLVRPAFYGSHHEIAPVRQSDGSKMETADIVGPVCESGDFLATDREFPQVETGDLLAVMSAGAYCFTMSSNYNTRPRAAEVLVRGSEFRVIRRRESFEDMIRGETIAEDFGG